MSVRKFRGKVGGVTYTDPQLFEVAAKALGFRGYGVRTPVWKVGTPVAVKIDDEVIAGQVWAPADVRNYVWVALDSGKFVAVFIPGGKVAERPSSREWLGAVA